MAFCAYAWSVSYVLMRYRVKASVAASLLLVLWLGLSTSLWLLWRFIDDKHRPVWPQKNQMVRIRHQVSGWWIDHSPGRRYRERVRSQRGWPVSRLSFDLSRRCYFGREPRGKEKKPDGLNGATRGRQAAGLDAAGAAIGSLGLLAFAFVVWRELPGHNAGAVLASATLVWPAVSGLLWWVRKPSDASSSWFSDWYRGCPL